jgi:hypothetical protein
MQIHNRVAKVQNMTTHRRRYAIHRETTTHHRRAKIVVEKRSPFRPHRGLAAPDLFLDTMLDRRTWEASPIDYTEGLGNIYRNRSQTCRPKDKIYTYAQVGELVHSVAVQHVSEHDFICGSKPAGEKHEEGETTTEQQPPQASSYEAVTSSQG